MTMLEGVDRLASVIATIPADKAHALLEQMRPQLNRASIDLLERIIGDRMAIGWRTDPWTLARHLDGPDVVKDWSYSRLLATKFRAAVLLESRFQVWSLPAQMGKSTWLRRGCTWAFDREPGADIIYLSYGDTLARESAIFVRDQAVTHMNELRFDLRPDMKRQNRWATTQGGSMLATGIGGGVSGFSAGEGGGVVVDDPLKNWQAAHSPVAREEVWNEIVAVARLRLSEFGWFIMAHTRWHIDDPTGRMHKLADELGIDVEFVTLPMLATHDDPLGRAVGEPLEPERYSMAECMSRAAFLGSYLTAAMEQQAPVPEEGGELKREWWKWTTNAITNADQWLTSWDMKLKDKESGDYVVGQAWARTGGDFWCVDQLRGQFSLRQTKVAIATLQHRHPQIAKHVIENTGNGPEVMAELRKADPTFTLEDETAGKLGITAEERVYVEAIIRRGMSGLVAENVRYDKIIRARSYFAPKLEAGNVHVIESSWGHALVDEAAAFPPRAGGHDDMVDCASQALKHLGRTDAAVLPQPARSIAPPSPAARATQARILR